ncbi:DHA2 family efflux MFS transporter permease subunit [Phenylobacterium montanum]|uniref:DHA2 family efflux MFS transporter permease subunit n=2 Tax=Phenylobacterium montanum TaxID=2823693 RepID=A0A975IXE9_9CAUL|nr:DHA2 family efflux MFS transporter permease subunit [Caulobacter sp. S6]
MVTVSVMLATIMTALDMTIANVALPHMAGTVGASADQITWVLTSYIVASAIMTPMSGWLAGRLGRKQVFVWSIIGFTVASALCGAAQSLEQIVLFRILQGAFGAAMGPLSQAVMLDTFPGAQRGPAMAIWGVGVMVAPIVGPVLGGWLTDDFSWRWVFYINLPIGVLCLMGVMGFIHDTDQPRKIRFDVVGFSLLSVFLGGLQLFLDRGQNNDWFNSVETQIEFTASMLALVLFTIHTLLFDRPFLPRALFKDANLMTASGMSLVVGMLVFSVLALLPPMAETLLGYPVVTTGLVMAPRGLGGLVSMLMVGQLVNRFDARLLIATGFAFFCASFFMMSHFSLQMNAYAIAMTGLIQGLGTGLVFMPMTVLAFATLNPALRADAAGAFALVRNLGQSVGVSIMQALFVRNSDAVHARLTEAVRTDNPLMQPPYLQAPLTTPLGLAAMEGEVSRQAAMVAYIDVFRMMFIATAVLIPMVMLLRKPSMSGPIEVEISE